MTYTSLYDQQGAKNGCASSLLLLASLSPGLILVGERSPVLHY
jgi:hypothetical protein